MVIEEASWGAVIKLGVRVCGFSLQCFLAVRLIGVTLVRKNFVGSRCAIPQRVVCVLRCVFLRLACCLV